MYLMIIVTVLATFIPLLMGSLLSFVIKKKEHYIDLLLFVSAGTIFALLTLDIIPEAIEASKEVNKNFGILLFVGILVFGLAILFILHHFLDKLFHHDHHEEHEEECHTHGHIEEFIENKNENYLKAGLFLFLALLFHNLPEGISMGVIFKNSFNEGVSLASYLALHNLVMGLSMALPLIASKMKSYKIILLVSFSSLPSLLGSILGYTLIGDNAWLSFIMMSLSSSILMFVIFEELTPILHIKNNRFLSFLAFVIGFIAALVLHFVV